jgi:hypothetical protein
MLARWNYGNNAPVIGFAPSLLEQGMQRLMSPNREPAQGGLPPRSYLATFRENPGIELGVETGQSKAGVHALMGYY